MDKIYYDINDTLKHGALFNFVCGAKGCRKTTQGLIWGIKNYFDGNGGFLYLRRKKEELGKIRKLMDGINFYEYFPGYTFSCYRNVIIMKNIETENQVEIGEYTSMSTGQNDKGYAHPEIGRIIFDEFLPEGGYATYFPNEIGDFNSVYEYYSRGRDITMIAFSNALTMTNPYFLFYGLHKPPKGKDYMINNDVLLHLVDNKAYTEMREKTRYGQIMKGTQIGDYAMKNKFLLDDYSMLSKLPASASYLCTILYKDRQLGCWIDYKEGYCYVTSKINKNNKVIYAVTKKDQQPNTMILKAFKNAYGISQIVNAFYSGYLLFDCLTSKNLFMEIIKMSLGR